MYVKYSNLEGFLEEAIYITHFIKYSCVVHPKNYLVMHIMVN